MLHVLGRPAEPGVLPVVVAWYGHSIRHLGVGLIHRRLDDVGDDFTGGEVRHGCSSPWLVTRWQPFRAAPSAGYADRAPTACTVLSGAASSVLQGNEFGCNGVRAGLLPDHRLLALVLPSDTCDSMLGCGQMVVVAAALKQSKTGFTHGFLQRILLRIQSTLAWS